MVRTKDANLILKVGCGVVAGVIVLLYILGNFVVPNLQAHERQDYLLTMHRMEYLGDALHHYHDVHGQYPRTQPAAALLRTLAITNYPELRTDAWGHEFRYESEGCRECGFRIASPGKFGRYERADLGAYTKAEPSSTNHPNVVLSDEGWIQSVMAEVNRDGRVDLPRHPDKGRPLRYE